MEIIDFIKQIQVTSEISSVSIQCPNVFLESANIFMF